MNDTSDGVCGYTVELDRYDLGSYCCNREVWKDERCIWHAEESDKPTDELLNRYYSREKRYAGPNFDPTTAPAAASRVRLDGAKLVDTELPPVTFSNCTFVNADLKRSDLTEAQFSRCLFWGADLTSADLSGLTLQSVDFYDATLRRADLDRITSFAFGKGVVPGGLAPLLHLGPVMWRNPPKIGLQHPDVDIFDRGSVNFAEADLGEATLQNADLRDAVFYRADLERAKLDDSDLGGASLTEAAIYKASFGNVTVDIDTRFGKSSKYETDAEEYDDWFIRATWSYKRLREVADRNSLSERRVDLYIADKNLRRRTKWKRAMTGKPVVGYDTSRKEDLAKEILTDDRNSVPLENALIESTDRNLKTSTRVSSLISAVASGVSRWTTAYATNPYRVLGSSIVFSVLLAAVYPIFGLRDTATGETLRYTSSVSVDSLLLFGRAVYFSVVTFTTVGYGDVQPMGFGRAVAMFEAFVGSAMMALLVFVLGRYITR
nr:pentapeptide repeat-containing protein [Halorussus limi]